MCVDAVSPLYMCVRSFVKMPSSKQFVSLTVCAFEFASHFRFIADFLLICTHTILLTQRKYTAPTCTLSIALLSGWHAGGTTKDYNARHG